MSLDMLFVATLSTAIREGARDGVRARSFLSHSSQEHSHGSEM